MTPIKIRQGDTLRLDVTLTNNGEPFVPTNEQIVFAVGYGSGVPPIFTCPVIDGVAQITHEQTKDLKVANYYYDLRVYDASKLLVATPLYGTFAVLGVVNSDI